MISNSLFNERELIQILSNYRKPNTIRSIFQLITTFIPYFLLWYLAYLSLDISYTLTAFLIVLNTGFAARIFIIQHDCGHGALFKTRKIQNLIGCFCSIFTLIPYHYWRKVHAIHHADLGDLDNRSPGEFVLWTVNEYKSKSEKEKKVYRINRHPITLLFIAPFMLFFVLFRKPRKSEVFTNKENITVYITDIILLLLIIGISSLIGFKKFFLVHFPLTLLTSTIAIFLFYVQHQYENTYWENNKNLNFYEAAIKGSSFLKLPKIFQWFTGSVGYHHIHHLSPLIPNYLLEKCHNENNQFHNVTTIKFVDSFKTLNLALWDEDKKKLVTFKEI